MAHADAPAATVLTLPGWLGSGPAHWQSLWEQRHGCQRVEQHDWQHPRRGDWSARLEEVVLAQPAGTPLLLAAHSLGCLLVAWWAAHSRLATRVSGALLVAPPEIERDDLRQQIPGWAPPARQRLPFASLVVASSDDPFGRLAHARALAQDWGAAFRDLGARGHLNADSGLGDWAQGLALLYALLPSPTCAPGGSTA
ncbi:MAG: alpha/beta hydrolase [Rubrivivax sp.]|nr:alpha/beta hydrolase [Rubrivivax sp.]HNK54115.1 alpha/beta hydrolase [Ottowia sp.]HNN33919.1 alpha/beta hydrolase [Ottowia sp.]HOZ93985.1 alpha/beta hydrolase [Ottowia sp.]HQO53226.1 alpha/beta hydrolase [Ottowia sp.]